VGAQSLNYSSTRCTRLWECQDVDKEPVWIGNHEVPHAEGFIAQIVRDPEAESYCGSICGVDIIDLNRDDDALGHLLECPGGELMVTPHDADLKLRIGRRGQLRVPSGVLKPDDESEQC
jgi:hypothetical protein